MIKIICINNDYYPTSLQLNKEYEAKKEDGLFYIILDETLEEYYYPKNLFIKIN